MPRRYKKFPRNSKDAKKKAQKIHASRRLEQRYGIDGFSGISEAIRKIQSGEAEFIKRHSLRVTIWAIQMDNQEVIAVYDKQRKMIMTFLPDRSRLEDDYEFPGAA